MLKYISKLIKSCRRSQLSNILMFMYNCISTLGQMVDDIIYLQQMKLLQSFLKMIWKCQVWKRVRWAGRYSGLELWAEVLETNWIQRQEVEALIHCVDSGQAESRSQGEETHVISV